ncbi:alpha/beta hydrolase [Phytoactinopolyspora alkaliphila]|uniref:Alpha/beta hydrolase n=1 Tax=Phytoactinopolyspora alkaliphila TaxID=1783498 RepID=A0A6N9YIQ9_9ACTN|nr:alpha/beta hydrolase [Phytoactinopolyspora alkaliphila]NED94842.1 alpha/beta hydrolase [Phytoactinopolyspora alkaliphila]
MPVAAETLLRNTIDAPTDVPRHRSERHTVDGVRIHCRTWLGPHGDHLPAVVMLHGIGIASRINEPSARILARIRHVYAPDLPGFGKSQGSDAVSIEDYADVLDQWMAVRGLSDAVVTGVSVGAQIAAAVAQHYPGRCRDLVLASPTVQESRRSWLRQLAIAPVEVSMHTGRMRVIQTSDFARAGLPRLRRTFSSALKDRLEDRMPEIRQPALVCWGNRDPMLTRSWVTSLVDALPRGRLAALPGVRHAMTHEDPLPFCRATLHVLSLSR